VYTTICTLKLSYFEEASVASCTYGKNDFTEGSKILLDTDENNFVGVLKISNAATNFDILTTRV